MTQSVAVEYDPYSMAAMTDPHPLYRWLRDQHPVYRLDRYNGVGPVALRRGVGGGT